MPKTHSASRTPAAPAAPARRPHQGGGLQAATRRAAPPAMIREALDQGGADEDEQEEQRDGETRRERFERLATARVRRVLKDLRLIGNLASDNYDYQEEDAILIEETIREQVDTILALFKPKMRSSRGELAFTFHRIREEA